MKSIIKDTLKFTIITLVAGFFLGLVYEITKDPISVQEEKAEQVAYKEVFADAASFEESPEDIERLQQYLDNEGDEAQLIDKVMVAKDSAGNDIGYVLTVTSTTGYGGDITFSMGIQLDGTLNGISILSISETAGLGMEADSEDFKSQFAGKKVASFTVTKSGAASENEIDALSGATITTNAITDGVNAGLLIYQYLEGGR